MNEPVYMISTGVANTASVKAMFARLGREVRNVTAPSEILEAAYVVLPGVGSFGAGMATLKEMGFAEPLVRRVLDGRPTLAVCLGLQLLCASSEEAPGVEGLRVIPLPVTHFPRSVRAPHFGWNKVGNDGYAYFANSYRLTDAPEGWQASWTEYGGEFVSMLRRGGVLAAQFHPELSGDFGQELVADWLESTSTAPTGHLPLAPRGRIGSASEPSFPSNEGEVARPTGATVEVLKNPLSQPAAASPPKGGQLSSSPLGEVAAKPTEGVYQADPSPPNPLSPKMGEGQKDPIWGERC